MGDIYDGGATFLGDIYDGGDVGAVGGELD